MASSISLTLALAFAQVPGFSTHYNGWKLLPTDGGCMISKVFEEKVAVGLAYDERRDEAKLIVTDQSFRSLKDQEIYQLNVAIEGKNGETTTYRNVPFIGLTGKAPTILTDRLTAKQFLTAFEGAARLTITRGTVSVASVDISYGSGWQVSALRQCAAKLAKENPSDPFED